MADALYVISYWLGAFIINSAAHVEFIIVVECQLEWLTGDLVPIFYSVSESFLESWNSEGQTLFIIILTNAVLRE